MTRPKNPYSDDTINTRRMVWDEGYATGLRDGEAADEGVEEILSNRVSKPDV